MADSSTSQPPQQQPGKRLVKRKPRPARQQVKPGQIEKKAPEQTGQTYNLWYHKWAGGDKYDSYGAQEKSSTRVNLKTDAGYTRADGDKTPYICLFFARGCCPYGVECTYLHRLPSPSHTLPDAALDVFGREKHSAYRDDMGGVGSFNRQNRTLYIGRIRETRNTAEALEEQFSEFGEIERIRILTNRGVAFVTYTNELNAQFAKEAMMHQSLETDEVLNVRWATEDPNPAAAKAEHARLLKQGEAGIAKSLDPEFVQRIRELDELEGIAPPRERTPEPEQPEGPAVKRQRIEAPPTQEQEEQKQAPQPAAGILSAHAVDSLRFMAALREKRLQEAGGGKAAPAPAAKKATTGLGALAAYGSDDDSD
ncbi:hypothetical protein JCM10207_008885 [Rhodosporidiobolus poonsookiae]